jgi:hypothetical protein
MYTVLSVRTPEHGEVGSKCPEKAPTEVNETVLYVMC